MQSQTPAVTSTQSIHPQSETKTNNGQDLRKHHPDSQITTLDKAQNERTQGSGIRPGAEHPLIWNLLHRPVSHGPQQILERNGKRGPWSRAYQISPECFLQDRSQILDESNGAGNGLVGAS
ncbi:hypothetical protein N7513_000663 [Penicillium frequentans]|nr:hypothetical protein N7513_000663 [Penicillium glabrum]